MSEELNPFVHTCSIHGPYVDLKCPKCRPWLSPSPDAGTGTPDDESFKPFFDRAEQSSTYWRELYTLTQEALAAAMADNAALRADKERVDWLETQDCWIGICGDYNAEPIHSAGGCYVAKVRDICDAARAAKSEGGE